MKGPIDGVFNNFIKTQLQDFEGCNFLDIGGPSKKFFKSISMEKLFNCYYLNIKELIAAKYIRGSITSAPFRDESFDICFSYNVFEHLSEPWIAAEECVRLTRKGGLFIHATNFSWRFHNSPSDYFRYTHIGLSHLFERTNKTRTILAKIGKVKKKDTKWNEYWKTIYIGEKV